MTAARPGEESRPPPKGTFNGLEAAFSLERMSTCFRAAQGDQQEAPRLYTWNTATCAAFYRSLQGLEVALRNAIHRMLRRGLVR